MVDVLVVDDDADIRSLLELGLRLEGHGVTTSSRGAAAVDLLRSTASAAAPVVILDIQMPDLDGWEVLATIRGDARLRDLAVILCTVRASAADVQRGWRAGCDAYLTKPFDIAVVGEHVRTLAAASSEERAAARAARIAELETADLSRRRAPGRA